MKKQNQFNIKVEEFENIEGPRNELWHRAEVLLKNSYEIEAYILILSTWNFAGFRFFLKKFDLKKFESIIKKISPIFEKIKNNKFENTDFNETEIQEPIKIIYGELKEIAGQTGASKIMALKNPALFVMWDTDIRSEYKINNKAPPEDYIKFLIKMKEEFGHIKWNNAEKPFAKAIDEYNYVITDKVRKDKRNVKSLNGEDKKIKLLKELERIHFTQKSYRLI